MAELTPGPSRSRPKVMDEDQKQDYLKKKAKKKYKSDVRKFRRQAENDSSELNLTAMMDMMTILLVFLIKSYSAVDISVNMGKDLMPPTSSSTMSPVKTVTLTITKKDIAVGEKGVLDLENGHIPASAFSPAGSQIMPAIQKALGEEVDKLKAMTDKNKAARDTLGTDKDLTRTLTIVGDKDMPYETLFPVLGNAGQEGLAYIKLLVIQGGGGG